MSEQFSDFIQISDSSSNVTINLDGNTASITAGSNGQDGNLILRDRAGNGRVTIDSNDYVVESRELISLLEHDPPVVYNTPRYTPGPARPPLIMKIPHHKILSPYTRNITSFESRALKQLQAGRDLAINYTATPPQIVGAVRAQASCLKCHDVAKGDLLGAFTYALEEIYFIQPPSPRPEQ